MPFKRTLTATTTALTLALAATPVAILTAHGAAAQETAEYSGEQLDSFTVALLKTVEVRGKYEPVMQSAESDEQKNAIIEEANAEIVSAIEETDGMTLDDYQAITEAAAQDAELNARIMKRLEEARQTSE